jgi:hypothetical protein
MKQNYFFVFAFVLLQCTLFAQTTLTYHGRGAGGAEPSSTFNVTLNNLTTCQTDAQLLVNGYGYNPSNYPVRYKVIINETETIATMQYGENTYDLSAYLPITSVKVRGDGNVSAWIDLNVTLTITSPDESMPAAGPTVSNITYTLSAPATPLTATLSSTGTTLKWYTSEQGDNYSATAPTPVTTTVGTKSYWVAQATAGGCESVRSRIDVTVIDVTPANCLHFDGTNDYINIGNVIPSASSYTKEALIRTYNIANGNIISSSTSAFWFWQGNIQVGHGGGFSDIQYSATALTSEWNHVAVTYDAPTNTLKLYINGEMVGQNTNVSSYVAADIQIGAFLGGTVFNGNMDEVRIWNYARTANEIAHYQSSELQGDEDGLVAYYQFNQGIADEDNTSITSANDSSGNGNHGTLVNFGLNGENSNWTNNSTIVSGVTCEPLSNDEFTVSTFKVYPNPSNGVFMIDTVTKMQLSVYDLVGNQILSQEATEGSSALDLTNVATGIYVVKATSTNGTTQSFKVIKLIKT